MAWATARVYKAQCHPHPGRCLFAHFAPQTKPLPPHSPSGAVTPYSMHRVARRHFHELKALHGVAVVSLQQHVWRRLRGLWGCDSFTLKNVANTLDGPCHCAAPGCGFFFTTRCPARSGRYSGTRNSALAVLNCCPVRPRLAYLTSHCIWLLCRHCRGTEAVRLRKAVHSIAYSQESGL